MEPHQDFRLVAMIQSQPRELDFRKKFWNLLFLCWVEVPGARSSCRYASGVRSALVDIFFSRYIYKAGRMFCVCPPAPSIRTRICGHSTKQTEKNRNKTKQKTTQGLDKFLPSSLFTGIWIDAHCLFLFRSLSLPHTQLVISGWPGS